MRTNTFVKGNYHIVSYGNGWAYEITDQTTGYTMWVQDNAADELREATDGFDNTDCLSDYMEALGEPSEA
jgi:hypothetical protein